MMESIEKLRELAMDMNSTEIISHTRLTPPYWLDGDWLDSWHRAFDKACDEIEREIAERYMELPVDAEGVPIQVGDELETSEYGKRFTCTGYSYQTEGYEKPHWSIAYRYDDYDGTTEFVSLRSCRHVKPRTVEDVLAEFFYESRNSYTSEKFDLVDKYSDEIRGLI
jgi:hypothetical protein